MLPNLVLGRGRRHLWLALCVQSIGRDPVVVTVEAVQSHHSLTVWN